MRLVRKILLLTFCGMGVLFLLLGGGMRWYWHAETADMRQVEGVIVDFDRERPIVEYEGGVMRGGVSSSDKRIGDSYTLFVDDKTGRVADRVLDVVGVVFLCVGAVFTAVGVILWVAMGRGNAKRAVLLSYGQRVRAEIVEVRQDRTVSVNGRHPWRVYAACEHPITREQVRLRSHYVWEDVPKVGDSVDVAFDPMNEKRYAFDLKEEA